MGNNKKEKSVFIYLLILLPILVASSFIIIISQTPLMVPTRFGAIDYTWIAIDTDPIVDIHTTDGTNRFYVSKGGYQLVRFTNEGLIGSDVGSSTLYYGASAVFRFGINFYTLVSITDAFPNIELDSREERDYVEIYKFPSINVFPPPRYNSLERITASVNYRTIDFDRTVVDVENQPFSGVNLKEHDYEGYIPITVTMHEDWGTINEMKIAEGLTLYNPKILAEVKKVVVDVVRSDIVGDYNDVYKGGKESFGSVSVQTYESALPSLGAGDRKAQVTQNIQDLDLGCTFGDRIEGLTVLGGKTGKSELYAEPEGVIFDNMESTPSFRFNLPARIKPEISYCSQDVEIRWARLEWDYEDALWSEATVKVIEGPVETVYPRYPSGHVTNRYVHQEFNVEMNFIASLENVLIYSNLTLCLFEKKSHDKILS
ncbi:unnamed protein product [marine sediment metagenome]|uniref:Uncharacterized protein n=1 Tax=marine sediment metagenome TaxID=412755 RepID=X1AD22_9ZZZZ